MAKTNPIILISLDGFRHDYLKRGITPNINALVLGGTRSKGLIPSFPSKTFVSHTSIVTGLHPVNHGIVDNLMFDPIEEKIFSIGNYKERIKSKWWNGEPIWATAVRQGLISANIFWPGDQLARPSYSPTHWVRYNRKLSHERRIEKAFKWLDLPAGEKPDILSMYFHDLDSAGHLWGPDGKKLNDALRKVDKTIGNLIQNLKTREIFNQVNIILVSDHGMSPVSPERVINLDDYIATDSYKFVRTGPIAGLHLEDKSQLADAYKKLKNAHPNMRVYTKENIPSYLHYKSHIRIPDIIMLADDQWLIEANRTIGRPDWKFLKGVHGYDNKYKSMHGLFLAHGPDFPKNLTIEAFPNIEIYNLLCKLLKIEPAPNDGTNWLINQINSLKTCEGKLIK